MYFVDTMHDTSHRFGAELPLHYSKLLCVTSTGLDPFGAPTLKRPWDDGSESVANAKRRLRAAFEFMSKLGVKYWTYHDRCVSVRTRMRVCVYVRVFAC